MKNTINMIMERIEKGDPGYIDNRKVKQLLYTFIFVLIIGVFFFTGYIRYGTSKNVLTVFSVVSVLPMAKHAVIYIILFPFNSIDKEKHNTIKEIVINKNVHFIVELVITSEQKVSNVDMICIKDSHILCYVSSKKTDIDYINKYIKEFVSKSYRISAIKTYTDFKKYSKEVTKIADSNEAEYDYEITRHILAHCV